MLFIITLMFMLINRKELTVPVYHDRVKVPTPHNLFNLNLPILIYDTRNQV